MSFLDQLDETLAQIVKPKPPKIALPGSAPTPATLPSVGPKLNPDYQAQQQQLDKGSGLDQFQQKHRILGTGLKIADVMGTFLAPKLAVNIPGTQLHHQALQNQLNRKEATTQEQAIQAGKPAAQESLSNLQTAEAGHLDAETDALRNPAPQQGKHIGSYVDDQGRSVDKFQMPDGSVKEITGGQTLEKTPPEQALDKQYSDALAKGDYLTAQRILKVKHDLAVAGQAPQRDPKQLAIGPDGKVIELRPGMTVQPGTQTASGALKGHEPTADEKRRGDLADNMNENLNQLESILQRRPDLFGPVAGRMTGLKSMVGTNDPDVAALETIKQQMGMAMVGAHAMRNAQHVATAANAIVNSFHNDPVAVKGAIDAARKSLQTFQQDVAEHQQTGAAAPKPQGGGTIYARDPSGKLHQAPAGTPLPKGWKLENAAK